MHFASDNTAGASPKIAEALLAANSGNAAAYGNDELTAAVEKRLSAVFERDVAVFLVATGTAANALSIAALSPPWGAVFCHRESHLMVDECGAP
ncbi:MAG: low specificity L-threonine aldolase, partial [Hyphomicrobiales bacterium]|nr:low specificity L-threonine aldolase [Hyphomicrobiales bacterium]